MFDFSSECFTIKHVILVTFNAEQNGGVFAVHHFCNIFERVAEDVVEDVAESLPSQRSGFRSFLGLNYFKFHFENVFYRTDGFLFFLCKNHFFIHNLRNILFLFLFSASHKILSFRSSRIYHRQTP